MPTDVLIRDSLTEFILGRGAKREQLDLVLDGRDLSGLFKTVLGEHGYRPASVGDIPVQPGERVPAFLVEDRRAHFGWVFWEKFTDVKKRKLWGSVARNKKGDWAIQIPPTSSTHVYANIGMKILMETDRISTL